MTSTVRSTPNRVRVVRQALTPSRPSSERSLSAGVQLGVLGRNQRADEVVRTVVDRLEVVLRVVALVEDQGDVFGALFAVARDERVGQAGEGGRLVSGVGMVQ